MYWWLQAHITHTTYDCLVQIISAMLCGTYKLVSYPAGKIRKKIRLVALHAILGTCQNFSGRNLSMPIQMLHFLIIAIQKKEVWSWR